MFNNIFDYPPRYQISSPGHRTYYWGGPVTIKVKPNPGEYWYVKMPGASALQKVFVKSCSAHTVLLTKSKVSHQSEGSRYITEDVTWVEQATDDDND